MSISSWFPWRLAHQHKGRTRPSHAPALRRRSTRLACEQLEDRTVPSTLTVLNNLDSGAGSLRDTIKHADSGDTIVFARNLYGQTITLTSGDLAISQSLDIEGPGASLLAISGNNHNRIFDVSQNQKVVAVTIAGLTIENGLAADTEGGGILNVSSTLMLNNDVLLNNEAVGNNSNATFGKGGPGLGGAISNRNSATLTVSGCTFSGNEALSAPGGLAGGGAISNWHGATLTVSGSTFSGNEALGSDEGLGFGGAILNLYTGSAATVTGSIFTNNIAQGGNISPAETSGGAIENREGANLTVIGSTFSDNEALSTDGGLALGGAIYNIVATATVTNSIFTGNIAQGGNGPTAPSGLSLSGLGLGGAITNDMQATLSVSGSTFTGNEALGGSNIAVGSTVVALGVGAGGGLFNVGFATVTNSTFTSNEAVGGNGNTGGNSARQVGDGFGGGIDTTVFLGNAQSLNVTGCTFTSNQAVGGTGNTGGVLTGDGAGGGLANRGGGTATVTGSTFTGNSATGGTGGAGQSGGAGLGGGIANLGGASLIVSSCAFSGNLATGGAGGAGANGGNGFGGGIYNDGQSTFTILTSNITANQATGGAAGSGGSAGQGIGGGAYFADGGSVCLDALTIANILANSASTSDNDVFGAFAICP